jgi:predicted alpha/beta-fold hydrolase
MFYLDFKPLRFFSDCHAQTILGSLTCFAKAPPSRTEYLLLADMDCLTMEICTPKNWNLSDPTVVLIHGLCGSDKSNYLQRLTKKFYSKGIQTVRVNLRGCGTSKGIARYFYHCGSSDDVLTCLKRVKSLFPRSPISLIGFSLGGNIALKLAGDLALAGGEIIKQVIAVNPPADLKSCVQTIGRPENSMYERYFIRLLREDVHFRHKRFGLPLVNLPKNMSIFEFDEYYIAPQIGYKSALDYYEACSSKRVIDKITVSCQILLAADDPIINTECFDKMNLPENVRVIKTPRGGHLGFLSSPFAPYGARWMDHFILSWVDFINPKVDLGKDA